MQHIQITLTGYIVGNLWMPDCEAWKHLTYDITRENNRSSDGKFSLREHLCRATNDGDFKSCSIAQGAVELTLYKQTPKYKCQRVTKTIPLERFKDAQDIIHNDPDWFPCDDDDYDDDM